MTDQKLAIIVLAAGQGTRMKSQTPKLLHAIAGAPIVVHVLSTARALDAAHVLSVVRFERDRVAAVIEAAMPDSAIIDQDEVPGTGRAVEQAVAALPDDFDGDVLVLNGDVPLLDADTLGAFLAAHRDRGSAASVLSAIYDDATGYGRVVRGENGAFDRIVEQKDATAAELAISEINAGVYAFGVGALRDQLANLTTENAQGEKYLTDVIGLLRRAGSEVEAVAVAEPWLVAGVNDRAQLAEAGLRLNALIVRGWQLAGVTIQDPATTWIDLTAKLEPDVTILPGTQILGATVVATGATIGPDTTLVDCEIGEGATVKRTDATLAVIGRNATVGPFSYLRPGSILGADGKIGTFVETKNARIGDGSKVPHLSYVGDAEIGEGSNIGAGSIFANYDGVAKHRSEIGSHVRTGSHGVFVAPIRIGDGAYTGAGTVVRKDVPAGSLAVNVAPQRNIEGWVQKNRPGSAAAHAAESAIETDEH
ncbi:bifunctional UDP-N-acetylglucosamine diphosphorylase/glucosamine-1-phosphate N-acetyltransferase GlmU [Agromyces atrinae]|uniref:Bifunctional protein GlmU n=1 Tax=Agromyces atrinae TaxID=592376 RepID=A0A4V1R1W6_9MICO|nr:bifunctional UDP-N-acetylglucosamine diphosphorylase/glucosamine-1-phosphate N-acetyltransferase GlmU [Agromyces atrinae]NYD68789.1 bifunctional UDP-N-acetylglucosamine pyrophosphorylase/glucosamine-1-phosphate N-acetyltransferase [Agromyces atrinae]RXZ85086.1 bifunctional UDP-N-acetylglucosamine diphosphorylase/glucosamine-1-phosphate N-acetyltransferase GlmU [Agromyces atrinae]RXZ85833.1 bifunctional UDP-N-acetylglucosamine diphosphorylase/glucosamine-1-phosphate N-acetyltransferase GlmU [A